MTVSDVKQPGHAGRHLGSTLAAMLERTEYVAGLLARGLPKGQVKRAIYAAFGCGARQAETLISRAREALVGWSGQPKSELWVEAVAFYRSVIQAPGVELRIKLLARERLDRMFGLEPPHVRVVRPAHPPWPPPRLGPPSEEELAPYFDAVRQTAESLENAGGEDGGPDDEP
jgi:hypothetical protein